MSAYCPECETDLDQSTGICPACRWDPVVAATTRTVRAPESDLSLTERYRGTRNDVSQDATFQRSGVSRGRAFVIVALAAAVVLYGAVMMLMVGPAF